MSQLAIDVATIAKNLITEDDEPLDNPFSEKQQRFLAESLHASWQPIEAETGERRKFFAAANVGVFYSVFEQPIVPDVFISLDVEFHKDWLMKEHRAYFVWEMGKVPDLAIEVVSNTKDGEISGKKNRYAHIGVQFYVVYDPFLALSREKLRVFELGFGKRYRQRDNFEIPEINLNFQTWSGEFENWTDEWLRVTDADGKLLLTGTERANSEAERANLEAERANLETERAERLAAKLRELGVDPEQI